MFKSKTLTGKGGKTYYIEKEVATKNATKHSVVIDDEGDSLLCITLDLKKTLVDKQLLNKFCSQKTPMEEVDSPSVLKIIDKIVTASLLHVIVPFFESSLEEVLVKKDKNLNLHFSKRVLSSFDEAYTKFLRYNSGKNEITLSNIFIHKGDVLLGGWDLGVLADELFISNLRSNIYKAPELLGNGGKPGVDFEKSDMWSVGVVLYALSYGNLPFKGTDKDEVLSEINNSKKLGNLFPSKSDVSFELKNLIGKMLTVDPKFRISYNEFKEAYVLQALDLKTGMSKMTVSNAQNLQSEHKSIIERLEKNDLRLKIETNLSHSLAFKNGESLTTMVSSVNFSALTHSASDGQSDSNYNLSSEEDIEPALLQYLFEKNVIIFIMDSGKKLIDCEGSNKFQGIDEVFQLLELVITKKAFMQNYYILQVMQNKINIFNITNFDDLSETVTYRDMLLFFKDFNDYTRQIFHKMKIDHLISYPKNNEELQSIELMDMDSLNVKIGVYLNIVFKFYKKNKDSLDNVERHMVMQVLVYLLYNKNSAKRFEFSKFSTTNDWVEFCGSLSKKPYMDIEKIFDSFKL
jgi:hypothetical protein